MCNRIGAISLLFLGAVLTKSAQAILSPHSLSFVEEVLLDAFDEILGSDEEGFQFFVNGEDHRHLQSNAKYEDPVWWRKYKSQYGKQFKRCKFQANIAPEDGSTCPRLRVGDYTCMFEDQICEDGSVEPAIKCDCATEDQLWQCEKYQACQAQATTVCPLEHPVTASPPLTCSGELSCQYGTESCCGEEFAMYECTCKDGVFDCSNVNACTGLVCPTEDKCPNSGTDIAPEGKCDVPPDVSCAYGQICCCDNCMDQTTCMCDEATGEWVCSTVAFRCQFPCPPEISGDKCAIEGEVVAVGETECCGSKLPEWECTCTGGTYSCDLKNSPLTACVCAEETQLECPGKDTDTPPAFGSECPVESQTCSYQEDCCCNDCMDTTTCTCTNGSWECLSRAFDCFEVCPPAITDTSCDTEGEVVIPEEFPTLDCCGSSIPQFECTCTESSYVCKQKFGPLDVCVCAEEENVCPGGLDTETPPEFGSECSLPADVTCSYGEICCCNNCEKRFHCNCFDGSWMCAELAFGCLQTCPPAISGTPCTLEGETLDVGEYECCGSTLPIHEVTCTNGVYTSKLVNDPMFPCLCAETIAPPETVAPP